MTGRSGDAVRFRRGWFLGDGTGAGKGRQVAGVLLDNWLKGRRRASATIGRQRANAVDEAEFLEALLLKWGLRFPDRSGSASG